MRKMEQEEVVKFGRKVTIHYSEVSLEAGDALVRECLGNIVDLIFEDPNFEQILRKERA